MKSFLNIKREMYKYMAGFQSSTRLFDGIMYIAVVVAGSLFMIYGKITPGDLVAYLLYVTTLLTSIRRVVEFLDYPAQLEAKRQQVADALARIGGIDAPVLPCLGMDEPWRFRNKGQFPIGLLDQGPAVGFYALRSHRLIPLADCPVLHPAGAAALGAVQAYLDRERPAVYDERTCRGELRHLMVRVGAQTGQVMVVLVTRTPCRRCRALRACWRACARRCPA